MTYRIVWNDGSSAKYHDIEKFLDAIHDEVLKCDKEEFIVLIDTI